MTPDLSADRLTVTVSRVGRTKGIGGSEYVIVAVN